MPRQTGYRFCVIVTSRFIYSYGTERMCSVGLQPPVRMENIDLNQLRVFEAVHAELNVTRAAERLNMSQSSVSKELSKLRLIFNNPLFLRTSTGVTPTHKAKELAPKITETIQRMNDLFTTDENHFDAQSSNAVFHIAATEYVAFVLIPELIKLVGALAPNVSVAVHNIGDTAPEELLLSGKVDLVLSSTGAVSFPIYREALFQDDYVCLARQGNPIVKHKVDIDAFGSANHIAAPGQNGSRERRLTDALQQLGVTRKVTLQLPHFLAVPATLANSNLIITIARKIAEDFTRFYELQIMEHPLPLGSFEVYQIWHDRTRSSSAYEWLRNNVRQASRNL